MMTRTSASMARSFQPAGHRHRGAGGRNSRHHPSLPSHLPQEAPLQPPMQANPSLALAFQPGLGPERFHVLQEEERGPELPACPSQPPGSQMLLGGEGASFRVESPGSSLTGLADHVSQREAGFLGRADIPAASSHLGSRSHRCLVSATSQVLEEDTPTAGLLLPPFPPSPAHCWHRAASGRLSMGALLTPDTPAPGGQPQVFQRSWVTGRETESNPPGLGSMSNWLAPASLAGFPSLSSSSF